MTNKEYKKRAIDNKSNALNKTANNGSLCDFVISKNSPLINNFLQIKADKKSLVPANEVKGKKIYMDMTTTKNGIIAHTDNIIIAFGEILKQSNNNVTIHGYNVTHSTHRILEYIISEYAQLPQHKRQGYTFKFSFSKYMELCHIESVKKAKEIARHDLLALTMISIVLKNNDNRRQDFINILDSASIEKDTINITMGMGFSKLLDEAYFMQIPAFYWQIDNRKNPNSQALLYAITIHKNMNYFKINANILTVENLASKTPYLPTVEDVKERMKSGFYKQIIMPFERDMNALHSVFEWHYQDNKGNKVKTTKDIKKWQKLNVFIQWRNYPERKGKYDDLMEAGIEHLRQRRKDKKE